MTNVSRNRQDSCLQLLKRLLLSTEALKISLPEADCSSCLSSFELVVVLMGTKILQQKG